MRQEANNRPDASHPPAGVLVLLALIPVVIGGFLRLIFFEQIEFGMDGVTAILTTKFWLSHGVPFYGQMSGAGVMMPPGFIFFLYPLVKLTGSPLTICFAVTCCNIAAVWLICRLGAEAGGPRAGFWAGAFMAVHPWLIIYSRMIWPQCLLPFFVTLFLIILAVCTRRPKSRLIFWCGPLLSLTWQIHYSAYCVLVFFIIWFAAQAIAGRIRWTWAAAGFLAGLLIFYPHLHFLIYSDFQSLRQAVAGAGERIPFFTNLRSLVVLFGATSFAGGLGFFFQNSQFHLLAIAQTPLGQLHPWLAPAAGGSSAAVILLVLAGFFFRRRILSGFTPWLGLMAVLPVILYSVKGARVPPWYFLVGLPAVVTLAGEGMERITEAGVRRLPRAIGRRLPLLLGGFIVLAGGLIWLVFLGYIKENGGTGGMYGPTYRVQKQAAEKLLEERIPFDRIDLSLTRGKGFGVAYLLDYLNGWGRKIEPGGFSENQARVVDTLLFPGERCSGEETPAALPSPNPLLICISPAD